MNTIREILDFEIDYLKLCFGDIKINQMQCYFLSDGYFFSNENNKICFFNTNWCINFFDSLNIHCRCTHVINDAVVFKSIVLPCIQKSAYPIIVTDNFIGIVMAMDSDTVTIRVKGKNLKRKIYQFSDEGVIRIYQPAVFNISELYKKNINFLWRFALKKSAYFSLLDKGTLSKLADFMKNLNDDFDGTRSALLKLPMSDVIDCFGRKLWKDYSDKAIREKINKDIDLWNSFVREVINNSKETSVSIFKEILNTESEIVKMMYETVGKNV